MNKPTHELNLELFERLLTAERSRIDEEISRVRAAGNIRHAGRPKGVTAKAAPKKNSLAVYNRTPEAKRKQSLRMKKYWAARRAEKAKTAKSRKKAAKRVVSIKKAAA